MEAELASVLAAPIFARSPVQARLLTYLVEASISGRGKALKSYSLAVEGLGKSPDFDPQADSYARVQVGRLRKSLDTFYASAGARHSHRLAIEGGSYEVRLVPNDQPPVSDQPALPAGRESPVRRFFRLPVLGACLAVIILAALIGVYAAREHRATSAIWKTDDFPTVSVDVRADGNAPGVKRLADVVRQSLLSSLGRYETISVSYAKNSKADYVINAHVYAQGEFHVNSFLVDRRSGALIWSQENDFPHDGSKMLPDIREAYADLAFTVAHPTGVIHATERRHNYDYDTPYGCWLTFSSRLYNSQGVNDGSLAECAQDWYSQVPNHPLAAALYGWSLIDKSIFQLRSASRERTIRLAVRTLEDARALDPGSTFLQIATIRAYAFAGNRAGMVALADRAVSRNPDNLDLLGFAGTMLALQNEPQGDALIERAVARNPNPPPWYFVGLFVSAMMREDVEGAQRALGHLSEFNHSLPIRQILAAAGEARAGHLAQARAFWQEARRRQPILGFRRDILFRRLPMAPEVRKRLNEWLAPVLG